MEELEATQKYLASTSSHADCTQQQCTLWVRRLSQMSLEPGLAISWISTIRRGPWTPEQLELLIQGVNSAVLRHGSGSRGRRSSQTVDDFSAYLTKADHAILQGDGNLTVKLNALVTRMVLVGIHLPSERTIGVILSQASAMGLEMGDGSAKDRLAVVHELKRLLRATLKNTPRKREHLATFPPTPAGLPEWLQKEAYDEADPPVAFALPIIREQVPMRRTNKAVVKETQVSPSASSGLQGPQHQLMMWMQELLNAQQQQRQPSVQLLKPAGRKRHLALPAPGNEPCQKAKTDENGESQDTPEQSERANVSRPASPQNAVPQPAPAALPNTVPAIENGQPHENAQKPIAALNMPNIVMAAIENRKEERAEEKAKAETVAARKAKAKAKSKAKAAKAKPQPRGKAKAAAKAMVQKTQGSTEYTKMFYKETNKAAIRIKGGKQLRQFGCHGQSKEALYRIANEAIDSMTQGTLQLADCKGFCEEKAAHLG